MSGSFAVATKSAIKRRLGWLKNQATLTGTQDICFFWIPKTAGTALAEVFSKELGMQKLKYPRNFLTFPNKGCMTLGHVHYLSLLEAGIISQAYHARSYKFTVVRDPYARAVSMYNYLFMKDHLLARDQSFDAFLDDVMYRRPPVGLYQSLGLSHTNPQVDWLLGEDGEFLVDAVFRMEDLEALATEFAKRFSVQIDVSQKRNVSKPRITLAKDVFGHAERTEKINAIYARDFERLGYSCLQP